MDTIGRCGGQPVQRRPISLLGQTETRVVNGSPQTGGSQASIRQSILDVALAHHLVSPYTSLVAVDTEPIRPSHASLTTHAMKPNLPEGQDYQAIFGLPRTATNAPWHMLIGVMALMLAFWMWRHQYRIA